MHRFMAAVRTVKTRLRRTLVQFDITVVSCEPGRTDTPVPGHLGVCVVRDQARTAVVTRTQTAAARSFGTPDCRAALTETALVARQTMTSLR